jgi:hypothetical protein
MLFKTERTIPAGIVLFTSIIVIFYDSPADDVSRNCRDLFEMLHNYFNIARQRVSAIRIVK